VNVQVFGTRACSDTRKALRFFKERRIDLHFVDLEQRAAAKGELRRFVQKFGVDRVIDRESKRFLDLGLRQALYGEDRWLEIMADEPGILRTPLVRNGTQVTVGHDETAWRAWTASR
jgi:arsenate reductase (glutaredoxin)